MALLEVSFCVYLISSLIIALKPSMLNQPINQYNHFLEIFRFLKWSWKYFLAKYFHIYNTYSFFSFLILGICSFSLFFFLSFSFSRAAPVAYGGSQGRGLIRAVATGLHQSHSNAGSEPRLQPTPQLTATPDR